MEAEDLVINESGQRQVIEEIGERLPNICVSVFTEAFIIETVYLCNLT